MTDQSTSLRVTARVDGFEASEKRTSVEFSGPTIEICIADRRGRETG
jgi:hypothetical protein